MTDVSLPVSTASATMPIPPPPPLPPRLINAAGASLAGQATVTMTKADLVELIAKIVEQAAKDVEADPAHVGTDLLKLPKQAFALLAGVDWVQAGIAVVAGSALALHVPAIAGIVKSMF